MENKNAPAKKRPGRPRKSPSEKLEQFSIRLPPKLKLGLELLARAQHRSLSQAVEWALNAGLSKYQLKDESYYSSLASLLDDVWDFTPAKSALTMLRHAPELMLYEDRIAAELVEYSVEMQALEKGHECAINQEELYELAEENWPSILKVAEHIISVGESPRGLTLLGLNSCDWMGNAALKDS